MGKLFLATLNSVAVAISSVVLSVAAATPALAQRAPAPRIDSIAFRDGRTCLEIEFGQLPAMLIQGRQFGQGSIDEVAQPPAGRNLAVVGHGQHSHFRFSQWDRTAIGIWDFRRLVSGTPLQRGLRYYIVIERADHTKRLSNLKPFQTCP